MPLLSTASVAEIITKLQDLEVINSKADLASVIGSPAVNTDPIADMIADIQQAKTDLAAKLSGAGITAVNTEALQALVGKASIGKKLATGTVNPLNSTLTVNNLTFQPDMVIIFGQFITSDSNRWYMERAISNPSGQYMGASGPYKENRLSAMNSLYSETHGWNEYSSSYITINATGFTFNVQTYTSSKASWVAIGS